MSTEETKQILGKLLETQTEIQNGQIKLAQTIAQQYKEQNNTLMLKIEKSFDDHIERHHPEMEPDHHEQHKRLGGWQTRIDGMWKVVFNGIAFFILVAIGYGVLTIINMKQHDNITQYSIENTK